MARTVGVLALQGDFEEHADALLRLGADVVQVRLPRDLARVDALIIPGGESTTLSKLLTRWRLRRPIIDSANQGMAVWGTCAGAILLAKSCSDEDIDGLSLMDIAVQRNAFGRQVDSFERDIKVTVLGLEPFRAVFIRAPKIITPNGADVLAILEDGSAVAVREDNLLATTFHPELTEDLRFHEYFLEVVAGESARRLDIATMD